MTRKTISALPSQVSLKSIMLPSINGFEKIYGNIESFVKGMGLCEVDLKYDYLMEPVFKGGVMEICIDTREQDPLPVRGKIQKLSVGDYVPNKDFYADVYIDRKSLPDLVGTLTSGYDRVVREIERAKEMEFYLVFLVEDLFSSALNYSGKFTKRVNGAHIMHQIRELMDKYDNIQFVFSGNRTRSVEIMEKIFRLGDQVRRLDLEWLKDRRVL